MDSLEQCQGNNSNNYSKWNKLPDLILEIIFSYLSIKEKYWASLTCKNWYNAFHSPETWSVFVLNDYTLVRRKFNYHCGWQYVLDHHRTMQCILNVGCHIRYLIFEPMMNFYNLYQFMNIFSYYAEERQKDGQMDEKIGQNIKGLKFVFPCTMRQKAGSQHIRIYGTGGQILASLKRLMSNLQSLRELQLVDLMLEHEDAKFLLDDVCNYCCLTLTKLVLINVTKEHCPLLHPGVFLNLHTLVISPQNLSDDLVLLLGFTNLRHLHIKSNLYSPPVATLPSISTKVWQQVKKENRKLSVHIECTKEVFWQYQAPVKSLVFNSPQEMVHTEVILSAIENYGQHLEAFIHYGIPRFYRAKSFHDRADSSILLICRQCPCLQTLVIRERISTATILLIITTAKKLKQFIVRKNAVIIKTDWPKSHEWSNDFYDWLKSASRKYDMVEKEVSQILGYRWKMYSDKEFKNLHIKLYKSQSSYNSSIYF